MKKERKNKLVESTVFIILLKIFRIPLFPLRKFLPKTFSNPFIYAFPLEQKWKKFKNICNFRKQQNCFPFVFRQTRLRIQNTIWKFKCSRYWFEIVPVELFELFSHKILKRGNNMPFIRLLEWFEWSQEIENKIRGNSWCENSNCIEWTALSLFLFWARRTKWIGLTWETQLKPFSILN